MPKTRPIKNQEQIESIANYLKDTSERDYILFMLAIHTGIRMKELLYLRVRDVKDKEFIEAGSSSTARQIPVNKDLGKVLDEYIKEKDENHFLVHNLNSEHENISDYTAYRNLKIAFNAVGLEGGCSLRKTFGYWYYKEYKDVALLKKILGQNTIIDSLKYIDWTEGDE